MKTVRLSLLCGCVLGLALPLWPDTSLSQKIEALKSRFYSQDTSDPIVARIGSEVIRRSDVLARSKELNNVSGTNTHTDTMRKVLNSLIAQKSLAVLAREAGIENNPEFQKMVAPFLESQLGLFYFTHLERNISVTDAEIESYYAAHPERFIQGGIQASRIVTKSQSEAEKALKMLKAGIPFAKVVNQMTMDQASMRLSGQFTARWGITAPNILGVLYSLKKGEISGIVPTQEGFQIVRRDQDEEAPAKLTTALKDQIRRELRSEKLTKKLADEKASLSISINEKELKALASPSTK
jgi:hypothetical protein